jgi:predicted ABC-type transport system involved in lysophospholipase L1 biosynthesis ATPase subunit
MTQLVLSATEPVIDIDDAFVLHRGRAHDVAALRGLSLQVDPGERIVLRGPSGSGKSTLVAALTAQVRASAGRVRLFGHDMAQLDHAAAVRLRTEHVGVVSQRSGLDLVDDLDCLDNVALQSRLSGVDREANASASRSPPRWLTAPGSSSPTSRPASSTPSVPTRCTTSCASTPSARGRHC